MLKYYIVKRTLREVHSWLKLQNINTVVLDSRIIDIGSPFVVFGTLKYIQKNINKFEDQRDW